MLALVSILSQGLPIAFDPFLLNLGLMESLYLKPKKVHLFLLCDIWGNVRFHSQG